MTRIVPTLSLLLTAAALSGSAQQSSPASPQPEPASEQPPVTFRSEVNYVEVDARVFDAEGRFVRGLTEADFQLTEDGTPQKVIAASLVNLPVEQDPRPLFAAQPIEPDVQTNVRGYNGRVYLLVLDDLHTHPLRSQRTKAAARQFIERHLGSNDVAAVVHTSGRRDAGQEFTNNRRLLLAAVDKFMGRKVRSSTLERNDLEQMTRDTRSSGDPIEDPSMLERGFQARTTLTSLRSLSDYLINLQGRRKAMVFFSEGIDYDITDPIGGVNRRGNVDATAIMTETRDAIAAATRANVAVYGVDPRGLTQSADETIEVGSFPQDQTLGIGTASLQNELRLSQDSLRVLSDETGGFAAVNRNDLSTAFTRIVEENSTYYVLGYTSSNQRRDGRFRKIEVRVNRPGLTVRARRGYVAQRGRAASTEVSGPKDSSLELRRALNSPLPLAELPLAVAAAVFKGPAPNGAVAVSVLIGARDLELVEKNGTFTNELELALLAVDPTGKSYGSDRNTVSLTLEPDTVTRVRNAGFRVLAQMEVPPGRYQLRTAVREANGQRAGSVFSDLEIPNFAEQPLALSSIALTSASSGVAPTARSKDPLADLLPGPLTSYREFGQNDELAFFAEAYDSIRGAAHKVALAATLKAEGGQTVFESREERDSTELGAKGGGYGVSGRIPLKSVAPGLYVLRVEAQALTGERPTVERELILRVVATPPVSQGAAR